VRCQVQPAVYWRRYELTSKETMKTVNLGEIPCGCYNIPPLNRVRCSGPATNMVAWSSPDAKPDCLTDGIFCCAGHNLTIMGMVANDPRYEYRSIPL